eukprot:560608-Rhodomonas_salina.5
MVRVVPGREEVCTGHAEHGAEPAYTTSVLDIALPAYATSIPVPLVAQLVVPSEALYVPATHAVHTEADTWK